jgi:hypothetical protein
MPVTQVRDPLTVLPAHRPGSARRITSLAIEAVGDWDAGVVIHAAAEDRLDSSDSSGGSLFSSTRTSLTAELDPQSRLTALGGDISQQLARTLIGLSPVAGFRKKLAALTEDGVAADSLYVEAGPRAAPPIGWRRRVSPSSATLRSLRHSMSCSRPPQRS